MKKPQFIYILLLGIFFIQSCRFSNNADNEMQISTKDVSLFQNGKETILDETSQIIEVDKNKFSLRFYNKRYSANTKEFYSAQIAAFLNKTELDKIKIGMLKSELPCFEPGSGMAPYGSGRYECLIFSNNAHHYLIYENPDSKTLNLIGGSGDYLHLEFEIDGLYYDNKEIKIAETDLNEFYIAFLIDSNLNGEIDEGELKKLTIKIK